MSIIFTLGDLLRHGDTAASAGTPLTLRWAQARTALLLVEHACGDLDGFRIGDFGATFPERFADLDPAIARRFPTAQSYRVMRREIPRLFSLVGAGQDDGWDSLRTLARVHHGEHAFLDLVYLSSPARAAGLAPSGITPAWAFAHDAALRQSRRWTFRRSLRAFDMLFDVPRIAASGLLPATRIGSPPVYDRQGCILEPLPPRLSAICSTSSSVEAGFVRWLWKELRRVDGIRLPADPSADDLLAPGVLDQIEALRRPAGIEVGTFAIYRTGAVRVLRRHATHTHERRIFRNAPEGLPAQLSRIRAQAASEAERTGLTGVWKAIQHAGGLGLPDDPAADDLIAPATWARIAALPVEGCGFTPASFDQYRRAAARILRRHATHRDDRAPVALPPRLEGIHAAARNRDERNGLRAIWRAIRCIDLAPPEDPTADELLAPELWGRIVKLPSEVLGFEPSTWNNYRRAAARALRRHAVTPAPPRSAKCRTPRPDRRRRGNMALPAALAAELDVLLDLMGYAPNSRRELRSIVARQFTAAHRAGVVTLASTLREVLDIDNESSQPTDGTPRQHAALEGIRAALRLAEAPAWRKLQSAVSRAGVTPVDNPVPALFEAAGDSLAAPRDLTREWAWRHERGLRPDLRITFSADIDRLDALRAIPVLASSGLLPVEPLGPMPPRGGRHAHGVYPLPRPIEAAIAALTVPEVERRGIEASVHFVWRHARDAGLHGPGDAPAPEELLSDATIDRLRALATGRGAKAAWREHMPRLRTLVPVQERVTPKSRWEELFIAARGHGLKPAALVPLYVVKSAALASNLGPDELGRSWAAAAAAASPRAAANTLNRGLRILDALRDTMPSDLLPPAPVGDGRPVKLA